MTISVLICDDSGFARKQMARSIPKGWDVDISYAENGQEALDLIKQGKGEVLFLDLNMPILDGYETMQCIQQQELPSMVIVVSGDVQPEARARMMKMGALDFIQKPIDKDKLFDILKQYGLYSGDKGNDSPAFEKPTEATERLDAYKEMANVAMGRAGEKLAKLLGVFVNLPIPNVNEIASTELHMAIAEVHEKESISAISQGFVSPGINGEALLIFDDANVKSMAKLLKYGEENLNTQLELEVLMDISNILVGACLTALSEQIHVKLNINHPIVLGRHTDLKQLLSTNVNRWNKITAIEIAYAIEGSDVHFDLMLLFPDSSMENILDKLVNVVE